MARPRSHRLQVSARYRHDAPVPPDHAPRPLRRGHRRPRPQAELPADHAEPVDDPGDHPHGARCDRPDRAVAPLHARPPARPLERSGDADAAVLRDRNGGARGPAERGRPQLRDVQRRPPSWPCVRRYRDQRLWRFHRLRDQRRDLPADHRLPDDDPHGRSLLAPEAQGRQPAHRPARGHLVRLAHAVDPPRDHPRRHDRNVWLQLHGHAAADRKATSSTTAPSPSGSLPRRSASGRSSRPSRWPGARRRHATSCSSGRSHSRCCWAASPPARTSI